MGIVVKSFKDQFSSGLFVISVFDFFFPAETKCTQILIGLCFLFFWLDGADERLKESSNIIAKYPDRVPVSLIKCLRSLFVSEVDV